MSEYQKLIRAIKDALDLTSKEIMIVKLATIDQTLNGISSYAHKDAVLAAFGFKEGEDA
jgi:hypothetical protein